MCLLFGNVHAESEYSDSDDEPAPKLANIPHQNAQGQQIGEWVFKPKKGARSTVPKSVHQSHSTLRIIQGAPVNNQAYQVVHSPQHQQIQLLQPTPAPAIVAPAPVTVHCVQPHNASQHQIPRVYTSAVGGWYLSCHNCPPPSALFTSATRGACAHIGLVNGNGGLLVSEPVVQPAQPAAYYTQYMLAGRHIAIANNNPREILLFQDGAWRPATVPLVVQGQTETMAGNSGNRIQLIS